jgi:hypothetical protein
MVLLGHTCVETGDVMNLLLLVLAAVLIVALSALPKMLIERNDKRAVIEAVDEYRSTLPIDDTVTVVDSSDIDLDAKWNTYWANSRAEENALRADLNDWVGWAAELEDRFILDCNRVIKQFTVDAITLQAETASRLGGWKSDVDRRSDVIIANSDHSIAKLNHALKIEVAECTATQWTKEDGEALAAYIDSEEVKM